MFVGMLSACGSQDGTTVNSAAATPDTEVTSQEPALKEGVNYQSDEIPAEPDPVNNDTEVPTDNDAGSDTLKQANLTITPPAIVEPTLTKSGAKYLLTISELDKIFGTAAWTQISTQTGWTIQIVESSGIMPATQTMVRTTAAPKVATALFQVANNEVFYIALRAVKGTTVLAPALYIPSNPWLDKWVKVIGGNKRLVFVAHTNTATPSITPLSGNYARSPFLSYSTGVKMKSYLMLGSGVNGTIVNTTVQRKSLAGYSENVLSTVNYANPWNRLTVGLTPGVYMFNVKVKVGTTFYWPDLWKLWNESNPYVATFYKTATTSERWILLRLTSSGTIVPLTSSAADQADILAVAKGYINIDYHPLQ
jgi:hypothetical protein